MRKFVAGVALGLALGTASTALAANLVGGHEYLIGFDVTLNGKIICSDPWIWTSGLNEIECD